jgi:very-short-patch-repair endonuclease
MIARARELRTSATEEERLLWYRLRLLRRNGYHFRRQSPFGRFVLDFVCHKNRVVVEVDGWQHGLPDHQKSDAERDRFLAGRGYRMIRIPNWWVKDDPDWVGDFVCKQTRGESK